MEATVTGNNQSSDIAEESSFFSVSTTKLAVMSICTLGLYILYWLYKNFEHIKKTKDGYSGISPFWRAFFGPIWAYSCFDHIQDECDEKETNITVYAGLFAFIYFILQATWQLPEPYMLVSYFSFVPFVVANTTTAKLNQIRNPAFIPDGKFRRWNWLALTLGTVMVLLSILGAFLPPQS